MLLLLNFSEYKVTLLFLIKAHITKLLFSNINTVLDCKVILSYKMYGVQKRVPFRLDREMGHVNQPGDG